MKAKLALLLFLSPMACAQGQVDFGPFSEYANRFKSSGDTVRHHIEINDLTMRFLALPNGRLGQCEINDTYIDIDPTSWAMLDDTQKEIVIFHELGHCVLGRPHKAGMLRDGSGCPASIMFVCAIPSWCYNAHKSYYVNELFNGGGK